MADIEERISGLANEPNPADDVNIILDYSTWPLPRQSTKAQLLAAEIAARLAADLATRTGAGLLTNGLMPSSPSSNYLKNADFIAAGYSVNEYNALLLLDAAINSLALNGELDVIISLSKTEILALNSTPVLKLAAPLAGTFYHITEFLAKNNYSGDFYVCNAAGIVFRFVGGGADAIVTMTQAFVQSAAVLRMKFPVEEHALLVAAGIEAYAPVADPTENSPATAGTIQAIFRYQVLSDFAGAIPTPTAPCCIIPLNDDFINADLTGLGNLEIHHAQGTENVLALAIIDNTGAGGMGAFTFTLGNEAGADTSNYVTVPIGAPIVGTWHWFLILQL
ncbi:MAG: hypothetical protein V1904_01130 [Bacteroidota bacterium]